MFLMQHVHAKLSNNVHIIIQRENPLVEVTMQHEANAGLPKNFITHFVLSLQTRKRRNGC